MLRISICRARLSRCVRRLLQGRTMGTQGINALDHAYLRVVARLGGCPENMTVSAMARG